MAVQLGRGVWVRNGVHGIDVVSQCNPGAALRCMRHLSCLKLKMDAEVLFSHICKQITM